MQIAQLGEGPGARPPSEQIDVVVRLHTPDRVAELKRCLLSLVCQSYRPLAIHLCTQRFAEDDIESVRGSVGPILELAPDVALHIWNYEDPLPADARSSLLNLGIARSRGRYLAFLDYDDVVYPNAYEFLVDEIRRSGYAVAFAGVVVKHIDVLDDAFMTQRKERRFKGSNVVDLFAGNFCPIHSYVLDRARIDPGDLHFDANLSCLEDYDFLLRLCAKYVASFRRMETTIADYFMKSDGSNTVLTLSTESEDRAEVWRRSREVIEQRRRSQRLSPQVQRSAGIGDPDPLMTIADVLRTQRKVTAG